MKLQIQSTTYNLQQSVTKKENVSIPGFGKFVAKEYPAREYNNVQDPGGPKIPKEAGARVKFTPYTHFKTCVLEGKFEKK